VLLLTSTVRLLAVDGKGEGGEGRGRGRGRGMLRMLRAREKSRGGLAPQPTTPTPSKKRFWQVISALTLSIHPAGRKMQENRQNRMQACVHAPQTANGNEEGVY
jgi:hypothetical protein